jgi:hypothetical protein
MIERRLVRRGNELIEGIRQPAAFRGHILPARRKDLRRNVPQHGLSREWLGIGGLAEASRGRNSDQSGDEN